MGERPRPLYSAHADDPTLSDAVDRFVLGLAEMVDHLQDTHSAGDADRLARRARQLASDAGRLGFQPLADLAEALAACARRGKQEETRAALIDLTGIAQRIRMGHRGAV